MVDESVSGATRLPVPTPEEEYAATPEPTEPSAAPLSAEPDLSAAEAAVEPSPVNDGLTGELQVLTDSLEGPSAGEPASDEAAPSADEAPPSSEGALAAQTPAAEAAAPVAEEPAATPVEEPAAADAPAAAESGSVAESLDSIAPGTVAAAEQGSPEPVAAADQPVTTVSIWPFVGYVVVWLAAAGYGIWRFMQIPATTALFETDLYRMSMLVGLVLLAAGPALFLIVWIVSWIGVKNARGGAMFFSALIKGAVATLLGALIWWGALLVMDYLRLGRLF